MRILSPLFLACSFLLAFPDAAEASREPVTEGDRVLVQGRLRRKCSARVSSIPSPGFAQLSFDRPGCGEGARYYEVDRLQHLTFVDKAKNLAVGDFVVAKGHFGGHCGGKVKEVSRAGYVSVEFESLLCADTDGLYKASDLQPAHDVKELVEEKSRYEVGQRVSARGINESEVCSGEIRRLTSNGFAQISFDHLTCAHSSRLYPVSELKVLKVSKVRVQASGDRIFERVMREIATANARKQKRHARKSSGY